MFFLILISFLHSPNAKAAGAICDTIFRSSNVGCSDEGSSNSAGGSYPLLFDAFNFNPASLPTYETPIGVEGYYNDKKINFALLKGVEKLGMGISSKKSDTTFFSGSENYKVNLKKTIPNYKASSLDQYLNLGSAINLLSIPDIGSLPLGLGYRYSPETKKWTLQPGFELRTSFLSIGASYSKEKPDKYNDTFYDINEEIENLAVNGNLKILNFLLGYSLIKQKNTATYTSTISNFSNIAKTEYQVTTQILSSTLVTDNMSFTAAYRSQNNSKLQAAYSGSTYKTTHFLAGAAYKTDHLELGGFYNYVLNNDVSLLVKIFF